MADQSAASAAGAAFREHYIEADGFRIRYMEAGQGPVLVHLHGAGGLRLSPGHDLLSRHCRVIAFEMPGFGGSAENTRSQDMPELAATMAQAVANLGIDRFNLMGTSFGGKTALWLTVQYPERVLALVLEAPAVIRPEGAQPPSGSPEEMARRLFAHPERVAPLPPQDPEVRAKTARLTLRLRGPDRDAVLERRMRELPTPTLVLFGTLDAVIPPEMGRFYKELMPNSHLVFVYDAGHAISTDRPEAFTEVVGDFIERHEAFVISRTPTVINP
ncbi:MAG TPA: alpha/beta hydrolase [Stellaceae bacterium]|nr:alpha/beta hydrolase [Stellaceae bacterium]